MLVKICRKNFCLFLSPKAHFFYGMAHLSKVGKPIHFIPNFAKLGDKKGA